MKIQTSRELARPNRSLSPSPVCVNQHRPCHCNEYAFVNSQPRASIRRGNSERETSLLPSSRPAQPTRRRATASIPRETHGRPADYPADAALRGRIAPRRTRRRRTSPTLMQSLLPDRGREARNLCPVNRLRSGAGKCSRARLCALGPYSARRAAVGVGGAGGAALFHGLRAV
ncbi:hypothetical protein PsYK624_162860 [Phanerochaete sordida]|uniref:Uncharacterized protein n=1 Tax=Phanerochaete sordida TaxID=48140 RepID=A0A9P3GQJ2_9APHY|nr:hypothetical protein PsYK624_162860 [Phanerochaete sordida]